MAAQEREILDGRRGWGAAQAAFGGEPSGPRSLVSVGWHAPEYDPEVGYFAFVGSDASEETRDLVGEIVKVSLAGRSVRVYVLDVRPVPVDLSLCRIAFAHLGRLSLDQATALVEVV